MLSLDLLAYKGNRSDGGGGSWSPHVRLLVLDRLSDLTDDSCGCYLWKMMMLSCSLVERSELRLTSLP